MIHVAPPPLIGFEKPAIIRSAPDLVKPAMLPGLAPLVGGSADPTIYWLHKEVIALGNVASFAWPASPAQAGDLIIFVDHTGNGNTLAVPAGWTQWAVARVSTGGAVRQTATLGKIIDASDLTGNIVLSQSGSSHAIHFNVFRRATGFTALSTSPVGSWQSSIANTTGGLSIPVDPTAETPPVLVSSYAASNGGLPTVHTYTEGFDTPPMAAGDTRHMVKVFQEGATLASGTIQQNFSALRYSQTGFIVIT